ncbi:M14 family metallopeptidase [Nonlabens ponticola]|uniref:Zinc carboxypeptidase n=1 Tax=Nonlabens ponticola TaxID=2496866 RepID=A0A3S9N0G3_9FLAO|nr:M14 family metallopeptidase [Nonlabens ponticola]AZQ44812.1 zinc carboxypeptidase [Nonlabens ponticola]
MIHRFTLVLFFLISTISQAQLQSPADFLGYELGTAFTRHAQVVDYLEHVANNSPLVTYEKYGETYERRPLTYVVITSSENHQNLESIRKANLQQTGLINDGSAVADKSIVWLSYNVHGNEASSTEAAMNTIYKLITEKKDWLQNTVVIMDPCVNPDGRDRYVNWFNQVASQPYDPSQAAAEHSEPWPGGRPNHYLFDLNRDWAWASQIETQERLKVYNQWMPHVHVDFHEQGINNPYYFAPAAEPFHEVITDFQRQFQTEIGQNHASYFDKEGWLYFTRERFDLLYPSYGDTYPTYMGAIGMTYEQAGHGRAGLGINTDEGYELTLVDRVAHHTTTGLSTIEVASKNAQRINSEFKKYFNNDDLKFKSFVLSGTSDQYKSLASLLDQHEIAYSFRESVNVTGKPYNGKSSGTLKADLAMVIHTDQPRGKMVQVLFEPQTSLSTPVTYDITAWNLVHAYGFDAVASSKKVSVGTATTLKSNYQTIPNANAGYIISWNGMDDARFLAALLKDGIKVRFSEKPFTNNGVEYDRGSLIIAKSDNVRNADLLAKLNQYAREYDRKVVAVNSSFASAGPDFGSPDVKLINAPRIALLKGDNISSLSYGAAWHFFEQQLEYPATNLDLEDLGRVELSNFDVIVMPNGYYGSVLNDAGLDKIKTFVRNGGKVVAIGSAMNSFAGKEGFALKNKEEESEDESKDTEADFTPYADREVESTKYFNSGSIFKVNLDKTHPLAFGYGDEYYTLKLGTQSMDYLSNGYNVGWIDQVNAVSGFVGTEANRELENTLVFGEERMGSGSFIYLVDDPLFRAFWENGKLFFVNSVFLVNNNKPTL